MPVDGELWMVCLGGGHGLDEQLCDSSRKSGRWSAFTVHIGMTC